MPKVTLTKIGSAERQLREAIRLFFENRDPLATHTLVAAAGQVTADLLKAQGVPSIIRSGSMVKPEHRNHVLKTMFAPENFLKHADRDPDATLDFNTDVTAFFMLAALAEYELVAGKRVPGTDVFMMWCFLRYPDLIAEGPQMDEVRKAAERARAAGCSPDDKADFLARLAV